MSEFVVKIQRDMTGKSILISEVPDGPILFQCSDDMAAYISKTFGIAPMGKVYVNAEVNEYGTLCLLDEASP